MLAVVVGLLAAADIALRTVAESQLRDRVVAAVGPAGETTARIESFPFVPRLLAAGEVARIRLAATEVTVEGLTMARVALDLHGVALDRDRLLSEQELVLASLDRGTATVEVTQAELSQRLGVDVTLESGRARVEVAGQTVTATASVSDNTLRLAVSGLSVPALRIPRLPLVPCVADAEILPGRIRLSCSVDQVPAELVGRPLDEIAP